MLDEHDDWLERHEKFLAFILLGSALVVLAVMVYMKPPSAAVTQNGAALAILNTIVGALTLAFGGAAGALFKISSSERKSIGQEAANAITNGPPVPTTVENTADAPVPVEGTQVKGETDEELPDYAR